GDRKPERIAIPIGGDDPKTLKIAQQLVREAGFDPVMVGSLAETRQFDLGQPPAPGSPTPPGMAKKLGHLGERPAAPAGAAGENHVFRRPRGLADGLISAKISVENFRL